MSKLIFQTYGPSLWKPSYNYAKIADAINGALLAGHPLVWSHPEEVGAFKLWNDFEQKTGLKNVYIDRWQYTSRDKYAVYDRENNSSVINDFIDTKIGRTLFNQVSTLPQKKFVELYNPDDWRSFGRITNRSDDEMKKYTDQMAARLINLNVPKLIKNRISIEIILIVCLLALYFIGNYKLKE